METTRATTATDTSINPTGVIDTWDNASRTWDSAYTWDGTTVQSDETLSSWSDV